MDAGDLDSGPYAYVVITVPIWPSPQPHGLLFKCRMIPIQEVKKSHHGKVLSKCYNLYFYIEF